jgi:hypothetical protein
MIDSTLLRADPDVVRASLVARGDDPSVGDAALTADITLKMLQSVEPFSKRPSANLMLTQN